MQFTVVCAPEIGDARCNGVRPGLLIVGLGRASCLGLMGAAMFSSGSVIDH